MFGPVQPIAMLRYFVIYKPFGILSQFSGDHGLKELGDFPPDVYPVGRLDKDSEGLLLITNDKAMNHHLLQPEFRHSRTYFVQVEGVPSLDALESLGKGVDIKLDGKMYRTQKAYASFLDKPPLLPDRNPPIRFRKHIPDSWIKLTLREGKNRQVRKMTAAVGFPTLRLVRWSVEGLTIEGYAAGEIREYGRDNIYALLKMDKRKFSTLPKKGRK